MNLTKNAIEAIKESSLSDWFKNELIKTNGNTSEEHYYGKYRGFFLFESDTDERCFALNAEHYKENEFNIDSYDGINEVKIYIDDYLGGN